MLGARRAEDITRLAIFVAVQPYRLSPQHRRSPPRLPTRWRHTADAPTTTGESIKSGGADWAHGKAKGRQTLDQSNARQPALTEDTPDHDTRCSNKGNVRKRKR